MKEDIDQSQPSIEGIDRSEQVSSCHKYLINQASKIQNLGLRAICAKVLSSVKFTSGYGSSDKHHNFIGGLCVHTSEVLENALLMAKSTTLYVNLDNLIAGVIYHDYGKFFDYKVENGKVIKTDHQKKIRHLSRSYAIFMSDAEKHEISDNMKDEIGHIILAHHGRQEWGSPVEPETVEALIIHCADVLSARFCKDYYVR